MGRVEEIGINSLKPRDLVAKLCRSDLRKQLSTIDQLGDWWDGFHSTLFTPNGVCVPFNIVFVRSSLSQ